jgi:chromate reductase
MRPLTVLTLSGSLRQASLNTAMLTMAADCAPPGMHVHRHRGLGDLVLFNPDLEVNEPPSVARLRQDIAAADAVLIASPEYAHGVSGVMKNALDWMVASGVFVDKPVVLWNASPRASHALAALRETLTVMSSRLVDEAGLQLLVKAAGPGQAPANPDVAAMTRALQALQVALRQRALLAVGSE